MFSKEAGQPEQLLLKVQRLKQHSEIRLAHHGTYLTQVIVSTFN